MVDGEENAYRYWLHNVPELGDKAGRLLLAKYKSAKALYETPCRIVEEDLVRSGWKPKVAEKKMNAYRAFQATWRVKENYEKMVEQGISMVGVWEENYPEKLKKLPNPPMILYYRGSLPDNEKPALAIIGARECSEYGAFVAKAFGEGIGKAGVNVISGMARGIDGIGQEAACMAGGSTYAVLGCGVDICYPLSNQALYQAMQEKGGVLSPFPPGTRPQKQLFPYRNGIVAGLADALLVIEARQKSGTWITVDMALEQGKDVYAIPGRLTDRLSDGCNLLIRQGAGIALTPEDMIAELALLKNRQGQKEARSRSERLLEVRREEKKRMCCEKPEKEEEGVMGFLDMVPKPADVILAEMKAAGISITLPELLFALIQLCMDGKASQSVGNSFSRCDNRIKSLTNGNV
jgi:DNA processing protein